VKSIYRRRARRPSHGGLPLSETRALLPLEFTIDGVVRNVNLLAPVAVNGAESLVAVGRLGLGMIQAPRDHVEGDLERGMLVPVLPDFPPLADTGLAALSSESAAFTEVRFRSLGPFLARFRRADERRKGPLLGVNRTKSPRARIDEIDP